MPEHAACKLPEQENIRMRYGLNRNQLKYIAATAMLLDHIGYMFCAKGSLAEFALRLAGRLTAPVMCFFLVEGFVHTSSRMKYCFRLLAGALLSQIPYTLVFFGKIRADRWNMMASLLLSFLLLWARETIQDDLRRGIVLIIVLSASIFCDWSMFAPALVLMLYRSRGNTDRQARSYCLWAAVEAGCSFFPPDGRPWQQSLWELGVFLFIPFLYAWNGKKGSSAPFHKWFFYAFYPLHLMALYLVRTYL
jgi:hypothetical protein